MTAANPVSINREVASKELARRVLLIGKDPALGKALEQGLEFQELQISVCGRQRGRVAAAKTHSL